MNASTPVRSAFRSPTRFWIPILLIVFVHNIQNTFCLPPRYPNDDRTENCHSAPCRENEYLHETGCCTLCPYCHKGKGKARHLDGEARCKAPCNYCKPGYFSLGGPEMLVCMPCTVCPEHVIIEKECTRTNNRVCSKRCEKGYFWESGFEDCLICNARNKGEANCQQEDIFPTETLIVAPLNSTTSSTAWIPSQAHLKSDDYHTKLRDGDPGTVLSMVVGMVLIVMIMVGMYGFVTKMKLGRQVRNSVQNMWSACCHYIKVPNEESPRARGENHPDPLQQKDGQTNMTGVTRKPNGEPRGSGTIFPRSDLEDSHSKNETIQGNQETRNGTSSNGSKRRMKKGAKDSDQRQDQFQDAVHVLKENTVAATPTSEDSLQCRAASNSQQPALAFIDNRVMPSPVDNNVGNAHTARVVDDESQQQQPHDPSKVKLSFHLEFESTNHQVNDSPTIPPSVQESTGHSKNCQTTSDTVQLATPVQPASSTPVSAKLMDINECDEDCETKRKELA